MSMKLNDKYWNNRYEKLETPWDVGKVSIPLKEYFEQISDKQQKILIQGSGNGYEGEYLFNNNFTFTKHRSLNGIVCRSYVNYCVMILEHEKTFSDHSSRFDVNNSISGG